MSHEQGPSQPTFVLLTCEHGGREVPAAYEHLFSDARSVLQSHRGYDIGTLGVALRIASRIAAPIIVSTVTRLLVDLNRSPDRADTFSEFTSHLSNDDKERIAAHYYHPHRNAVIRTIEAAIAAGHRVLHLGVHSCTDVLHGQRRELDISLLFDEARPGEGEFAHRYRDSIAAIRSDWRYPFNEPYRGADDGLTTTLRGILPEDRYLGIEIEVRQGLIRTRSQQRSVGDLLATALLEVVYLQHGPDPLPPPASC